MVAPDRLHGLPEPPPTLPDPPAPRTLLTEKGKLGVMNTLLQSVQRHTEACSNAEGVAHTAIPGLTTVRATMPSELLHAIPRPLFCLVLQGSKHVTIGQQGTLYQGGAHCADTLLITADIPTVSQITCASLAAPYLALVLELDAALIATLVEEGAVPGTVSTDADVQDAAWRIMRLLDRPAAVPVLHGQLVRELHYWLLTGRHGAAVRRLGVRNAYAQQVGRAITLVRTDFARALPIDELAAVAAMSASSFHHHFRQMTSLSPLQFQKRLRLIEARRLMRFQGASASSAAFTVGYESVPQFTRDYGKLFGAPPLRDARAAAAGNDHHA
jgi:AraC-like DNA-binding protein